MSINGALAADAPLFDDKAHDYDALLVLSFGGPEGVDDVLPFLENVTRGRGVSRERLLEVAEHYHHFGGVSPINAQNRALIAALEDELVATEVDLPIYFGNRNWHPFVTDTVRQMRADGVSRALVFVTSAFSSYSGCRQYREDVIRAITEVGEGSPQFDKLRVFYNHPGFVEPMADLTRSALAAVPEDRRATTALIFTAHSIPISMTRHCAYETQLREAARLIAALAGAPAHRLAYQSRSGSPHIPWLEPDILDELERLTGAGTTDAVVVPLGFISDHIEVLYDLDDEAARRAHELGMGFVRVPTVGTHPRFVRMIVELVRERMRAMPERAYLGDLGPSHDVCPLDCCLLGATRPVTATAR